MSLLSLQKIITSVKDPLPSFDSLCETLFQVMGYLGGCDIIQEKTDF